MGRRLAMVSSVVVGRTLGAMLSLFLAKLGTVLGASLGMKLSTIVGILLDPSPERALGEMLGCGLSVTPAADVG